MRKSSQRAAQSLKNNLNIIEDNRYDADKAKFIVTRIKELSGMCQQSVIVNLILEGATKEGTPYAKYVAKAMSEWNAKTSNI